MTHEPTQLIAELQAENARLRQELAEGLERQAATGGVLRAIASSPANLQSVLDALAENAARLCGANDALIFQNEGDGLRRAAHFGEIPTLGPTPGGGFGFRRSSHPGRAWLDRQTIHIADTATMRSEFPDDPGYELGVRSVMATPLLRDGAAIGVIMVRRTEVRPFTEQQIALLETFADQAVIAIENARLFSDLSNSLEQQTATSGVLRVIASSPTDLKAVLGTVAENAMRLCDATDAVILRVEQDLLLTSAHFGSIPWSPDRQRPLDAQSDVSDAILKRQTVHVEDILAPSRAENPELYARQQASGIRTVLATPLMREGSAIGVIFVRRTEVRPFTEAQIGLLETFADQAVIAIENTRLFQGLTDSLEQQTAIGHILSVIASSPADLQPVLDAVAESASRLFDAADAVVTLAEGDLLRQRAHTGPIPGDPAPFPLAGSVVGQAMMDRRTVHVHDIAAPTNALPISQQRARQSGWRTALAVPLLRESSALGGILVRRTEVRPFSDAQIALLETFANQAMIAIENTRLFQELEDRNKDLAESLAQQTATSEVLRVIASSPTDLQAVLDTVAENAARLCDSIDAAIRQVEGDGMRLIAKYGPIPPIMEIVPLADGLVGRAVRERRTLHVPDIAELEVDSEAAQRRQEVGYRSLLVVPLMRQDVAIGMIILRRMEARPFSEKQIALLEAFADQAVIAIENARLFEELEDRNNALTQALEQQTATGEVLRVIASSPTDLQSVLETVVENAARLCGGVHANVRRVDGNVLRLAASYGESATIDDEVLIAPETINGRAVLERRTIHIEDFANQDEYVRPALVDWGLRTIVATPLLYEGVSIGSISILRREVLPFTDAQIALLETFADQAVIAIENTRLFQELEERNGELTEALARESEALEQQTAMSEVLRVIASSPTDLQAVLYTVAENASRLCDADDAVIRRVNGDRLRTAAHYGSLEIARDDLPVDRGAPGGRAVIERRTVHVPDLLAEPEGEFPDDISVRSARQAQDLLPIRTLLVTPLLSQGVAIGSIHLRRLDVNPFTVQQIALLETFADQAVIAIENARLFQELEDRNRELDLALEQQTATGEVLRVIASSPTDLQTVLQTVAENAARLCGASDASVRRVEDGVLRFIAWSGSEPIVQDDVPVRPGTITGRAVIERRSIHLHDFSSGEAVEFPDASAMMAGTGVRTVLVTPLLREGEPIGTIMIRRYEVEPFSDQQIALLETFADQAVIAIENARLFTDLTEALDQQTATSDVLRVIARSPTDLQTVLNTLAESAAKLCDAVDVNIRRVEGEALPLAAQFGPIRAASSLPLTRDVVVGRAVIDRQTIHVADIARLPEGEWTEARERHDARVMHDTREHQRKRGPQAIAATPLMREGVAIGVIALRRLEPRGFTEKQISLLETFADQAVIAIENARLFQALEDRNNALIEALEQQTATGEVLRVIASSPTDLQAVLDAVAENAVRLCASTDGVILRTEGEMIRAVAHIGPIPWELGTTLVPLTPRRNYARAILERRTIHVDDVLNQLSDDDPGRRERMLADGSRTALATPLLRQGVAIGAILLRRTDVRPFTDKQIALLETFADQAVIAIENARLFGELENRNKDLTETLEQQTATGEILRVIASSPTDLQSVLDTIVQNTARLCDAFDVSVGLVEGETFRIAGHHGPMPVAMAPLPVNRNLVVGRVIVDRRTIHIEDLEALSEVDHPETTALRLGLGGRTMLTAPLLREDAAIGFISLRRLEVRPFTDAQVDLLKTFADQAVIAIENARLFQELEERNRDISESLEQQSATSEVLRVIASSPSDLQAVLNTVAENAARLCEASDAVIRRSDASAWWIVATYGRMPTGVTPGEIVPISRDGIIGRVILDRRTIHIADQAALSEAEYSRAVTGQRIAGTRTHLSTPLLRQGVPIGVITVRRTEVRAFTDKQIALLETFADQAVIAIENARLFGELESRTRELADSVEELQALGAVSQAVSSTLDLQQVLTTVLDHAVDLSGMDGGSIFEYDPATGEFHVRATVGLGQEVTLALREAPLHIGEGMLGRAVQERQPVQVADIMDEGAYFGRMRDTLVHAGYRAMLAVPLFREDQVIGGLVVRRGTPGEVPAEQVTLLQTFASQSALAIQNARLFNEIEEKSRQLFEASQHKSQFLANMSHELRTPLNAILGYTELILDEIYGDVPPKIAETLDRVQTSGRHLLGLINDVLDLSKMEAGQLVLAPQEYALADVIQTVHTAVESLASEKGIGLRTEIAPDLPTGYGDDRRLVQVILNLVGNAIKFTDAGEVVISGSQTAGTMFRVSVRDTGPGISAEQQGKIFEEFQQADTSTTREKGGTGLGLSIAKRIVELHGGRIWVESAEGQGSTFAFEIPVRVAEL